MTLFRTKASTQNAVSILQQIDDYVSFYLGEQINKVIETIENEFMLHCDSADCSNKSFTHLSKAIEVKKSHAQIAMTFLNDVKYSFTGVQHIHIPIDEDDLDISLIDSDSIQENLLIENISQRVPESFQPALIAISKGFSRLSQNLYTKPEPKALSPNQIGYAFQKSIKCLNLSFAQKPFLYNTLHNQILNKLDNLYAGILTILLEINIIDESENPLPTNHAHIDRYLKIIEKLSDNSLNDDDDPNDYTISDMTASDGTIDSSLSLTLNQASENHTISKTPTPATSFNEELFNQNDTDREIYKLITKPNYQAAQPGQQVIHSNELIMLLTKLQSDQATNIPEDQSFNQPTQISRLVNARLNALKVTIKKHVSNPEYNVIQFINKLFSSILSDTILPEPIKIQICRLQITYIKAALVDLSLLVDATHPTRLFLNEIAVFGIGATEHNHASCEQISAAVQYLLENYTTDADIFLLSFKKLRSIKKNINQKIHELECRQLPKTETKAKLIHRKKVVANTLKTILDEHTLASELQTLTLRGFTHILDTRSQNYGVGSGEFIEAVTLIKNIVNATQPTNNPTIMTEFLVQIPRLISHTRTMLLEVYSEKETNSLVKTLEDYCLKMGEKYKDNISKNASLTMSDSNGDNQPDFSAPLTLDYGIGRINSEPTTIISTLPEYIQVGAWFDVNSTKTGKTRRLKLISIVNCTTQLIFSNYAAKQTVIKNISTFIEEVNSERSRLIDTTYIFEKALTITITNMELQDDIE